MSPLPSGVRSRKSRKMISTLAGKTALVTGASRGVGRAAAPALAARVGDVVVQPSQWSRSG